MADPFLTYIATLIVIGGIGASAIAFALLKPNSAWAVDLAKLRPKLPPTMPHEERKACPNCGHESVHYYSIALGSDKLGCQVEGCRCTDFLLRKGTAKEQWIHLRVPVRENG